MHWQLAEEGFLLFTSINPLHIPRLSSHSEPVTGGLQRLDPVEILSKSCVSVTIYGLIYLIYEEKGEALMLKEICDTIYNRD